MSWQTPKTDWQAGDIPTPADFNRAEGNSEYLKTQTDGLKSGSIKAAKAIQADSVTSYAIGQVTINYNSYATVTHNLGSINVFVAAITSDGIVGGYSILNSNQVRIYAKHSGTPTGDTYKVYRYFIAK